MSILESLILKELREWFLIKFALEAGSGTKYVKIYGSKSRTHGFV